MKMIQESQPFGQGSAGSDSIVLERRKPLLDVAVALWTQIEIRKTKSENNRCFISTYRIRSTHIKQQKTKMSWCIMFYLKLIPQNHIMVNVTTNGMILYSTTD
ncbi:hypothetical protein SAY87_018454 [Trapa incisa]|uniref:Uncharacterized protein n=2 Tax=Trapa TaxID=22665 RepID=A0AAN7LAF3_TRANT|nr:hypothetical protein SAY87_018454 [Trapa incisa]KAK4784168.1 hypothetical protein SAY86_018536 [Trapa natans]